MVRMFHIGQNRSGNQLIFHGFTSHCVINAPSEVLCAGIEAESPPGVMVRIFVEMTERINETAVHKFAYLFPFIGQKTARLSIAYWIVNVDFTMADVPVATDDQIGSLLLQFVNVLLKIIHHAVLEILSQLSRSSRWHIETHH